MCPKLLKKFPHFMEPEGSSPHSQEPTTKLLLDTTKICLVLKLYSEVEAGSLLIGYQHFKLCLFCFIHLASLLHDKSLN
jgi:hypothetical protein